MQLRDWVHDRFGGTGENLLDESVYATEELRKDIAKLEHRMQTLEGEMDEHGQNYKRILKQGAQASELERKKYATKAKFEKKKYTVKKKRYRASSVKLGTLLSIQGAREIVAMQGAEDSDLAFDDVMESADARELQADVMEQMAAFGVEMEDVEAIQDALDIPIMDSSFGQEATEEEELMESMAASEVSEEQIDIEAEVEVDPETIDVAEDGEFDDLDGIEDELGV